MANDRFESDLIGAQEGIFAFILSLVGSVDVARDVLQDTNVVLWKKASSFQEGTNFIGWALTVARLEVLAYRRDRQRDRHTFDVERVGKLADEHPIDPPEDGRKQVFDECWQQLSERQRQLLAERYRPGGSVKEIDRSRDQSPGALSVTLSRLRRALANCIANKLTNELRLCQCKPRSHKVALSITVP